MRKKVILKTESVHPESFCETGKTPSSSPKILTQIGSYDVYSERPLNSSNQNYLYRRLISRNCTRQTVHCSSNRTERSSSTQSQ